LNVLLILLSLVLLWLQDGFVHCWCDWMLLNWVLWLYVFEFHLVPFYSMCVFFVKLNMYQCTMKMFFEYHN
jgi:hypothetical protein